MLACDSTTVNLYKLAGAALAAREGAIVVPADDFPTDRYVLEGLAAAHAARAAHARGRPGRPPASMPSQRRRGRGARRALARGLPLGRARRHGRDHRPPCRRRARSSLWDLCHSAGAVDVDLDAAGADLAVGCTYKYLNAGPGSPAFLYVRERHQDALRSPIQGWFSQADQFAMGPRYEPVAGIARFLAGTPPVLGLAAVVAGAAMLAEAGIGAVRAKAAALTALAVDLHDERLARLGFSLGTPRDAAAAARTSSLRHPDAWRICRALIEHADVVPDFRRPDSIRLGLPPLYTRFVDVWDAVDRLAGLVEEGVHERLPAEAARVT